MHDINVALGSGPSRIVGIAGLAELGKIPVGEQTRVGVGTPPCRLITSPTSPRLFDSQAFKHRYGPLCYESGRQYAR